LSRKPITYEEARELAHNGGKKVRSDLASRSDVEPEILYFLADDPSSDVRLNVANNLATPGKADQLLARDREEGVRQELAKKVARLLPDLNRQEQHQVYQATMETLEMLVRDQATKVRQIMAEALKDIADAPSHIINHLARDTEIVVAEPILTFSAVLSTEDLLDIISSSPVDDVINAIALRHELVESVSDAIVNTNRHHSIALLLGNASAQIREETLDSIIEMAPEIGSWHLPLVARPRLPFRAAVRLAHFVAASLVNTLQYRGDLGDSDIAEIREIVVKRIDDGTIEPDWVDATGRKQNTVVDIDDMVDDDTGKKKPVTALQIAEDMKRNDSLDEATVLATISRGDVDLVIAAISVLAEMGLDTIEKAMDMQDPEMVMAVCWKAGLSAQVSEPIQSKIAGIKKEDVHKARGTKYPISEERLEEKLTELNEES